MTKPNKPEIHLLRLDDPNFIEKFMNILGNPTSINLTGSQHERTDGTTPEKCPETLEQFSQLMALSQEELLKRGCRIWNTFDNKEHWLYPGEWYDNLPEDLPIVTILNKFELFEKGITPSDTRYGMLAYGFVRIKP